MKEITTEQLDIFRKGGQLEEIFDYVIITMKTCPICDILKEKASEIFGDLNNKIVWYTYIIKPGVNLIAKIFAQLDIKNIKVPIIIYRYQENNIWKIGAITDINENNINNLKEKLSLKH